MPALFALIFLWIGAAVPQTPSAVPVAGPGTCHPDPVAVNVMAAHAGAVVASSGPRVAKRPVEDRAPSDTTRRRRPNRAAYPDTEMVHLGAPGAGTDAFVAFPPGGGAAPSLVVVHEWWGLNTQIRELARRLAKQGYVAVVPDLYHGKVADDPETAHILMRGLDEDGAVADLRAAAAWLRAAPRTSSRKVGVMGFCMGGHFAELLAFDDPALSAAVVFYGVPEMRRDRIDQLHAPLMGHFGAEDQGIDTSRVAAFRMLLEGASKNAEIFVYPGAGHAFMNQEQKSYRPEAANLAWVRTLAFLQKYLKGLS